MAGLHQGVYARGRRPVGQVQTDADDHVKAPLAVGRLAQHAAQLQARAVHVVGPLDPHIDPASLRARSPDLRPTLCLRRDRARDQVGPNNKMCLCTV